MSNKRPLSYASLKCLIERMSPDLRLILIQKCPGIRNVERTTPLKLDLIEIDRDILRINQTTYQLTVIQSDATTDQDIRESSIFDDGFNYDVDDFGVKDVKTENEETPGDVLIGEQWEWHNNNEIQLNIKENKKQMKKGHKPTCAFQIQLVITFPNGKRWIERVEYCNKLRDAKKYLSTKLLGGRPYTIQTNRFIISAKTMHRLPLNIKIRPRHLETFFNQNACLTSLKTILDMKDTHLESISLGTPVSFIDPLILNAKRLNLSESALKFGRMNCPHPRVHITSNWTSEEDMMPFLEELLENGRPSGTWYSVATYRRIRITWFMNQCRQHIKRVRQDEPSDSVILSVSDTSKLFINCELASSQDLEEIAIINLKFLAN